MTRLLALTLLLLAVAVAAPAAVASAADPRLEEAFALLSPLHDRDGIVYADVLHVRRIAIMVGDLPPDLLAVYFEPRRRVIIAPSTLDEHPTMVASIMAHELQHAADRDLNRDGLAQFDCLEREARGFETQVRIWRAFWPDALPTRTQAEQDLAALTPAYDQRGLDGIRDLLARTPDYLKLCGDTEAPPPRPFQEQTS
jgi:hypothetical protein